MSHLVGYLQGNPPQCRHLGAPRGLPVLAGEHPRGDALFSEPFMPHPYSQIAKEFGRVFGTAPAAAHNYDVRKADRTKRSNHFSTPIQNAQYSVAGETCPLFRRIGKTPVLQLSMS